MQAQQPAPREMPPAAVLNQLLAGFFTSQAMFVVATLGIADRLKDGARAVADLAASSGVNAPALYRVLRALAGQGMFTETEPQHFALTPLGTCLRSDVPGSVHSLCLTLKWEWAAWGQMLHAVQTGKTAFAHAYGMSYFDYLQKHPEDEAVFAQAMTGFVSMNGMAAIQAYDFSRFAKIVDVGGGNGTLMTAILNACPQVNGVIVDLPGVAAQARRNLVSSGLADRCECVGQDIFESIPAGGDAYLLVSVIHDWPEEQCIRILENCRRAMRPESKLLLIEMVIPPGDDPFFGKLLDLEMLVSVGGRERTEDEYRELLRRCGFDVTRIAPTQGPSSVIEAAPR